jgi:multidrug efflux pump
MEQPAMCKLPLMRPVAIYPRICPSNLTYRKVNPAEAPILIMALTSDRYTPGQMYDAGSTILAQKLSQVDGVGQVIVGGSSLPGIRVELNPTALNQYSIGLTDVQTILSATNVNRPKENLQLHNRTAQIYTNDQIFKAHEYKPLIIAFKNGAPVRLADAFH